MNNKDGPLYLVKPQAIVQDKHITPVEGDYLCLVWQLHQANGCYATNQYFADYFRVARSTAVGVVSGLIKKGILQSEEKKQGKKTTERMLVIIDEKVLAAFKECNGRKSRPSKVGNPDHQRSEKPNELVGNPVAGWSEIPSPVGRKFSKHTLEDTLEQTTEKTDGPTPELPNDKHLDLGKKDLVDFSASASGKNVDIPDEIKKQFGNDKSLAEFAEKCGGDTALMKRYLDYAKTRPKTINAVGLALTLARLHGSNVPPQENGEEMKNQKCSFCENRPIKNTSIDDKPVALCIICLDAYREIKNAKGGCRIIDMERAVAEMQQQRESNKC